MIMDVWLSMASPNSRSAAIYSYETKLLPWGRICTSGKGVPSLGREVNYDKTEEDQMVSSSPMMMNSILIFAKPTQNWARLLTSKAAYTSLFSNSVD